MYLVNLLGRLSYCSRLVKFLLAGERGVGEVGGCCFVIKLKEADRNSHEGYLGLLWATLIIQQSLSARASHRCSPQGQFHLREFLEAIQGTSY